MGRRLSDDTDPSTVQTRISYGRTAPLTIRCDASVRIALRGEIPNLGAFSPPSLLRFTSMLSLFAARLRRSGPSVARPENLPYVILGVLATLSLASRLLLMWG